MRACEQLKAWQEIEFSSDNEEELTRQITVSGASGPSTSKTGRRIRPGTLNGFLSLEQGEEWALECGLGRNLRARKRSFNIWTIVIQYTISTYISKFE